MITGVINAKHQAIVQVPLQDDAGNWHCIDCLLDTGFSGEMTLPAISISAWHLPWHSFETALVADGSMANFPVHAATILWDGKPRPILVEMAEIVPLVGMQLLAGFDLRARIRPGGAVEIEPIP